VSGTFDRRKAFLLFERALGLAGQERAGFIRTGCAGDEVLRAEVHALLEIAAKDGTDTMMLLESEPRTVENLIGREFGRFRLVEFIGEGGMGVVYRAERTDGLQQSVAVKLIANQLIDAGQERFRRETQLLARLDHPAIARLVDAGVDSGRPWIALEFVRGKPIDTFCTDQHLTIRARVRLIATLAGAVAAAHRMLVVHRDIKPANVLVTADGSPKLIDFGIGSALESVGDARPQTVDVGRLFTPHYAAPEQLSGEPITVATDIFGLGALAYRLLTGRVPYPTARGAVGYLLAITQQDVDAPSRAALSGGSDPRDAHELRGDLDAILCKALDRDPARRYGSAADLQADLQRYLDDLPVVARGPSLAVTLFKFARRNLLAVSLSAMLVISLTAGAIGYALQARHTAEAGRIAAKRGEFLQNLLKSANPRGGKRDVTVAELLDKSVRQVDDLVADQPLVAASMLGLVAETDRSLDRFPEGLAANAREIELIRAHQGDRLELADALNMRGELLLASDKSKEAEAPLREDLALVENVRGADRQLTEALEALGKELQNTGRDGEAEAMFQREIGVFRKSRQSLGGKAGFPLANIGVMRFDQGRYSEATTYLRQALDIEQKYFPADHPDLLDAQYNYAVALERNHQAAQAEPVLRGLLETYSRVLGPEHADTLMAQQGLAHNLLLQHRYGDAVTVGLPAADGLSHALGEEHAWSLTALGVYGAAACHTDQAEKGLAALRKVGAIRAQKLGVDNWRTLSTSVQLGTCLVVLNRYGQAEPLLLQAVPKLEKDRGAQFDRTQEGYRTLGELYAATNRPQEAAVWRSKLTPDTD
jgi:tetratricopeptide (TPR) repeat protein